MICVKNGQKTCWSAFAEGFPLRAVLSAHPTDGEDAEGTVPSLG